MSIQRFSLAEKHWHWGALGWSDCAVTEVLFLWQHITLVLRNKNAIWTLSFSEVGGIFWPVFKPLKQKIHAYWTRLNFFVDKQHETAIIIPHRAFYIEICPEGIFKQDSLSTNEVDSGDMWTNWSAPALLGKTRSNAPSNQFSISGPAAYWSIVMDTPVNN